ncbi:MAG: transcription factor [Bogoriella megaspora]|nr:MAG: transcription factor [Bogoriella megaspora]
MPPKSAARRTRPRREVEAREESDAETPESIQTPSRKRRKVNGPGRTERKQEKSHPKASKHDDTQSVDTLEDEEIEDPEEIARRRQDELEQDVIRHLKVAKHPINAETDFSNEVHERNQTNPQAFAKLAGRTWTFYIKQLETVIGRPYQKSSNDVPQNQEAQSITEKEEPAFDVHIDLGPEKHVSRMHARIYYDTEEAKWLVHVIGRNGIRLDDALLRRDQTSPLRSGHVIDIAGTQMLFLLPNAYDPPIFSPSILEQIPNGEGPEEDEDDGDDFSNDKLSHAHPNLGSPRQHPTASMPYQQQYQFSRNQQGHNQHPGAQFGSAAPGYGHSTQYGTPGRSSQGYEFARPKQSPAYSRGVMMESTEDIDYSQDSAKDLKPPHSYAQLIGMAIIQSAEGQLTLHNIYEYIKRNYAYFRNGGGGWQNSIRHNLSLNKAFEKVARRTDEPGKGMKWRIVPEHREEFMRRGFTGTRKNFPHGSSGPSSPATAGGARAAHEHLMGVIAPGPTAGQNDFNERGFKESPRSATPPLNRFAHTYTGPTIAYTPDRGPRRPANGFDAADNSPALSSSTTSQRNGLPQVQLSGVAAGSPTAPGATALYNSDPPEPVSANPALSQANFVTPHLTRQRPHLGPPSTAQAPSQFMPMSSPAPFWRMAATGNPLGTSPVKAGYDSPTADEKHDLGNSGTLRDVSDKETDEPPRSSSPSLPQNGAIEDIDDGPEASPTRTLSRPASQADVAKPPKFEIKEMITPAPPAPASFSRSFEVKPSVRPLEDDDGGIDLTRGFQSIGKLHHSMTNGVANGVRNA